jgi:protein-disulfide isomerase
MWNKFAVVAALSAVFAIPGVAEDSVSCKQTDEILAELRQLRALLETRLNTQLPLPGVLITPPTQSQKAKIDVGNSPFLGVKDAPLTIVEFTDFQCPYCRRFFEETFPDLKKNYIDSGKVRFYSMDLPLEIHRNALLAAQAGRCAGDQGQFWAIHHRMQGNPERLELTNLVGYAQEFGLDVAAFRQCLESGKYRDEIQEAARDATIKGARGTPAFVIGKSTPTGVDGEWVMGAEPYALFDQRLRELTQ